MSVGQVAVLVPAAVIELDEAHAALGQAPRQQAVGGEGAGLAGLRAVQLEDVRRTPSDRSISVRARSSACGRPSRTGRCARRSRDRIVRACCCCSSVRSVSSIRRRLARSMPCGSFRYSTGSLAAAELHALVLRRQEAAAPQPGVERLIALTGARHQDDEAGQVGVLGAEPVATATRRSTGGRPAAMPVWTNVIAGSWLIASVCIDSDDAELVDDPARCAAAAR